MDDFIKMMDEAMVQLCNYDRITEEKRRDYGGGVEMLPREMHTLEAIFNHPDLNATELGELVGLQKGTFSKMTARFEKWGLLERYQSPSNKKEIFFRPTEQGKRAYDGHYRFHEATSTATYAYFHHYTETEQAAIMEFIGHYTQYLKEYF